MYLHREEAGAMEGAIAKWGNSLALRLPRALAQAAGLAPGSRVALALENGRVVIAPARPRYALAELLAVRPDAGRAGETNWGKRRGREAW
jgi:antitoxin MazE